MVRPSLRERLTRSLGDAYEIEGEIGAGMSRVFVATERALSRRVVIKVLPPEKAGEILHDRFRREIQVVATLQHPHIVPLLVAGEADGLPYFTMPYVEGETLRQRLSRGAIPTREAFPIFRDILKALAWAHARGVVHRDVKPENVMLSGGSAVVTDFGVAKALEASMDPARSSGRMSIGVSVGTPGYMAPEQAAADPATDHRADLYALGVMAYEALAGAHPFAGKQGIELLKAHAGERPAPLKARVARLPSPVANVIMQALEKDPDARPPNADAVLAVLEAVTAPRDSTRSMELPVQRFSLPAAPPPPAARPWPKGPTLVGVALGAALALLAFGLRFLK